MKKQYKFLLILLGAIISIIYAIIKTDLYKNFVLEKKARNSDIEYISRYLKGGGDPNFVFRSRVNSAKPLLTIAATNSDFNMTQLLVNYGANPNNYYGQKDKSPFLDVITHSEISNNYYKIIELFASNGSILEQNVLGNTPMHEAYRYGDQKTIQILSKHPDAKLALTIRNSYGEIPLDVKNVFTGR